MTESFLITTFSCSKNVPLCLQNLWPKLALPYSWRNRPGLPRWFGKAQPFLNSEGVQAHLKWSHTQARISAGSPRWVVATCMALEEAVPDLAILPPANKIQPELILLSSDHQLQAGDITIPTPPSICACSSPTFKLPPDPPTTVGSASSITLY